MLNYNFGTTTKNTTSLKDEILGFCKLQEKEVDVLLSDTTTEILPDEGYDGMSKVTVNHSPVESNTSYKVTSNGEHTITPSEGFDATTSVDLNVEVPIYTLWVTKVNGSLLNVYKELKSVFPDINTNQASGIINTPKPVLLYSGNNRIEHTWTTLNVEERTILNGSTNINDPISISASEILNNSSIYKNIVSKDSIGANGSLRISFPIVQDKTVSVSGTTTITADSGKLLKSVTVNVDGTQLPVGTKLAYSTFETINNLVINDNEEDVSRMFYNCKNLTNIDGIQGFDDKLNYTECFAGCENLQSVSVSEPVPSENADCTRMFYGCSNLVDVVIDPSEGVNFTEAFKGCTSLENFSLGNSLFTDIDLSDCPLSQDSIDNIFSSLAQVQNKTLTLGATNLAKVSDEQKNNAANSGWTLK